MPDNIEAKYAAENKKMRRIQWIGTAFLGISALLMFYAYVYASRTFWVMGIIPLIIGLALGGWSSKRLKTLYDQELQEHREANRRRTGP